MCELLAVSSKRAATVNLSLDKFAAHGSEESTNRDGWGIVFYEGDDIRRFRDTGPAASSPWVQFVESQPLCSTIVIAHIRAANVGEVCLSNTHPFSRELAGRVHTFAHNGFLTGFDENAEFVLGRYRPIGTTDSEWGFCNLLERLADAWMTGDGAPALDERFAIIEGWACAARSVGVANFIYCDGDVTFIHADRRLQADGEIRPPGLWLREHTCEAYTEQLLGGVCICSPGQAVTIVASVPLTDDEWEPLPRGTLLALRHGKVERRSAIDCGPSPGD